MLKFGVFHNQSHGNTCDVKKCHNRIVSIQIRRIQKLIEMMNLESSGAHSRMQSKRATCSTLRHTGSIVVFQILEILFCWMMLILEQRMDFKVKRMFEDIFGRNVD